MRFQFHNPSGRRGFSGIGATDEQITAVVGAVGSAIPVAGPFIAAAASIAVSIEKLFSGCGATCTEATSIANQVGDLLTQNAQAYVNSPVRTVSMQTAALQVFDNAWAQLVQACGNPQLGTAGQNCVSQRQEGGCQWKSSPGGWTQNADGTCTYTWAGAVGSGTACWNYFVGMRDPIANDPCVIPDAELGTTTGTGTTGTTGTGGTTDTAPATTNFLPLLVIAGGLLLLTEVA
jgi:hypothetical protein